METGDDERGFTIVDKRGESAAQGEPETEQPGAPPPGPLPPPDFSSLVVSLASSVLYHLGQVEGPEGEPGQKNLPLARHTIETLEMLQAKTQGNLADEEAGLLGNLLTDLRLRFVDASKETG